jgi:hypothetical protein
MLSTDPEIMNASFFLTACLLISALTQHVGAADGDYKLVLPSPSSIIVITGGRDLSIDQLCKIGFDHLAASGALPKGTELHPIVHIFPDDKIAMCEILYVQGFNQPYWRVKIDQNGKVISSEKRLNREG